MPLSSLCRELSSLRNGSENRTCSFSEVKQCLCVQGAYPKELIDLWEEYDDNKGKLQGSYLPYLSETKMFILLWFYCLNITQHSIAAVYIHKNLTFVSCTSDVKIGWGQVPLYGRGIRLGDDIVVEDSPWHCTAGWEFPSHFCAEIHLDHVKYMFLPLLVGNLSESWTGSFSCWEDTWVNVYYFFPNMKSTVRTWTVK